MKSIQLFLTFACLLGLLITTVSFTTSEHGLSEYFARDFRISNIRTPNGLCHSASQNKVTVTVTNQGSSSYKQDIPVRLTVAQKGYKTKRYIGKVRRGFSGRDTRGKTVTFNNIYIKNGEEVTLKAEVNYDKSVSESSYQNNDKQIKQRPKGKCGDSQLATAQSGKSLTVGVYRGSASNPMRDLRVYLTKTGLQKFGITANNGKTTLTDVSTGKWKVEVRQGTAVWTTRYYTMPNYNSSLNIIL